MLVWDTLKVLLLRILLGDSPKDACVPVCRLTVSMSARLMSRREEKLMSNASSGRVTAAGLEGRNMRGGTRS